MSGRKLRAAAYCRVSTDHGDQCNSLENQTLFFGEYIRKNPDWEFVGIYSDEGVTGTSVEKRPQFHRMIGDAGDGRIDLILTKEVSRFARNTVDALHYTRQLRALGVGVIFIEDNINTLEGDGELRLSLMSMLAQEESRRTSARVRWGMRRQMEQGYVFTPPMIGYDCTDGVLTVNSEEAEVVRRIFDRYVRQGMGTKRIAQQLAEENTPLFKRLKSWSPTAVMRILTNEKYAGDLIQQKTKVSDYLTHKSVKNGDEKLVFRDHHEPVVERAVWEEAQRIRQMRSAGKTVGDTARHSVMHWCSGKIECGVCRGSFVTKTKKAQYGTIRIYRCRHTEHYKNGEQVCGNRTYIDERILLACMRYVIRKLSLKPEEFLEPLTDALNRCTADERDSAEAVRTENEAEELREKKKKLLSLLLENVISAEDYREAGRELEEAILERERRLLLLRTEDGKTVNRIPAIIEKAAEYMAQETVTKELYAEILEKIVVYEDARVEVYLCGEEVPVSVSYVRKGRGREYTVFCGEDGELTK